MGWCSKNSFFSKPKKRMFYFDMTTCDVALHKVSINLSPGLILFCKYLSVAVRRHIISHLSLTRQTVLASLVFPRVLSGMQELLLLCSPPLPVSTGAQCFPFSYVSSSVCLHQYDSYHIWILAVLGRDNAQL